MRRFPLLLLLPLLLTACRHTPDHARFIPRNALSVVGINLGGMSQKITWSALTGADVSSGFDSLMLRKGYRITAEDLRHSGLDLSSTVYMYWASDRKPEPVAILPLENASEWKTFLQKTFPDLKTLPTKAASAAQLDSNLSAYWTEKVAFVRRPVRSPGSYVLLPDSTETWQEGAMDAAATGAALEALGQLPKEEAIIGDSRFSTLAKSDRDAIIWLNYEQMLKGGLGSGAAMSLLSNKVYQNMALATTVEFKDGAVNAESFYYASDALGDAVRKMGSGTLPKEMIARLPKQNMDGFAAAHLSLPAFRDLLDKMGLIGIVNMGLAAQQLSIDDITEALTGDIAVSINNYKTVTAPLIDSQFAPYPQTRPQMDYVVALRLGKQEKVAKLLRFLVARKLLREVGSNTYAPFDSTGSGVLVLDAKYAVAAATQQQAAAYLAGKASRELHTDAKKAIGNGPIALFVDFQRILNGMDTTLMIQQRDRLQWLETQRIFSNLTVDGGHFANGHLVYLFRLRLLNQQENALLQLLRYANRMAQIENAYPLQTAVPSFENASVPNGMP